MSGNKSKVAIWSEEDVDAALRDFFRAEMPAELRDLSPRPARRGGTSFGETAGSQNRDRRTGRISLSAAAAALFVAVSLVLTSSPSSRKSRTATPSPESLPVADTPRHAASSSKEAQLVDDAILNGRHSWHPAVIPVELWKFAPGLLTRSRILSPETKPGASFFPDIEVHPLRVDDEEGKPKPPKLVKPGKKN